MQRAAAAPRARRRRRVAAAAVLLLAGCNSPDRGKVPDFVATLPMLAAASSSHDSAMTAFARDLESWSARAGRPMSAEALIGPMFLQSSGYHALPAAADTGLEVEYQRLHIRFADLLARGDSLHHAADTIQRRLVEWGGRVGTPAQEQKQAFLAPIFPPSPTDPGRGSVTALVKCSLITVSVLPSKEGVSICVLKQKLCTRQPSDIWGDAWWVVTCTQSCFDYIGWVPSKGGFTVGAQ